MSKVNESVFWEQRYKEGTSHWDIGEVAPAFIKYFEKNNLKENKKVAVLGCGRGHDAFYLANIENSNLIYGFDFSESAVSHCNQIKEEKQIKNIEFLQADIFNLTKDEKWKGYFDCILEHTCFCAIDPKRREEYVELVKYLLKPNGLIIGLFMMRPKELGGPPYGSTPELIKEYFKDFKEAVEIHPEPCLHSNIEGEEWFGVFHFTK